MHYLNTESLSAGIQITLTVNYQRAGTPPTVTSPLSVGSTHTLTANSPVASIWVNGNSQMAMTKSGSKWSYSGNSISIIAEEHGSH